MRTVLSALVVAIMASTAQFQGTTLANAAPNSERGQVMPSDTVQMAAAQVQLQAGTAGVG